MPGNAEVLEALYPLFLKHGRPEFIRSDNGPEFIAENFQTWLTKVGIKPIRIYPGSPWENGYNEWSSTVLCAEKFSMLSWFTFNQTGSKFARQLDIVLAETVQSHPPAIRL